MASSFTTFLHGACARSLEQKESACKSIDQLLLRGWPLPLGFPGFLIPVIHTTVGVLNFHPERRQRVWIVWTVAYAVVRLIHLRHLLSGQHIERGACNERATLGPCNAWLLSCGFGRGTSLSLQPVSGHAGTAAQCSDSHLQTRERNHQLRTLGLGSQRPRRDRRGRVVNERTGRRIALNPRRC